MNRRNMLKLMAGSAIAAGTLGTATKLEAASNKDITSKIVIIGAGLAGITLAAKLENDVPNAKIVLYDKDENFYYQPGFTLVGAGIYGVDDVKFNKAEYIPEGTEWIKQNVKALYPEKNSIVLDDGSEVGYDYLVIATGVKYEFESVEGLSINDIYDENSNITSNYVMQGAVKTNILSQNYANTGGKAIFCEPRGAMKCAGANKKVMFLTEDRLNIAGNKNKGDLQLFGGGSKVFSNPIYAEMIEKLMAERGIDYNTDINHELIAVDKINNIATFKKYMPYTQNGEPMMAYDTVDVKYDWMHLTPKQVGLDMFVEAGLTKPNDAEKWVDVDKETLQNPKYKNIFAIGDVCGIPMGKTGASCRKMYKVVASNLISAIKGTELKAKFDGYTACPLITKYGKVIMVEFDWKGIAPSMPCFGATRESYLGWLVKIYAFRPMIMHGMLRARA